MLEVIIAVYIFLLVCLEGLGLIEPRWLVILLIALFPLLGILHAYPINFKDIFLIREKSFRFYLAFLLISAISFMFSSKSEYQIEILSSYIVIFFVLISFQWLKEAVNRWFRLVIYLLSYLFCSYTLFLNYFAPSFLIPDHGYQFIYSRFYSHNHLGDFLILPLVLSFYQLMKGKFLNVIHIITLSPFFFLAYSRSAYLSLILVLILIVWYQRRQLLSSMKKIIAVFFAFYIFITAVIFFSVVREAKSVPVLGMIHSSLEKNGGLKKKMLDARRVEYAQVSWLSFLSNPGLGVGPGNYIEASKNFLEYRYKPYTAHNIFFEIIVENGLPAAIFFILFIYKSLKNTRKDIYFFMAVALAINFQFDYTYRIYSFFFLFVILLSLLKRNNLQ